MKIVIDRIRYMTFIVVVVGASLFGPTTSIASPSASSLSAEEVREDLEFIKQTISENHPDPAFSTNTRVLNNAYRALQHGIRGTMTQDEVWAWLAKLNPIFSDGHFLVGYPDWRRSTVAYRKDGGALFPYEVRFSNGHLVIQALLGGGDTPLRGTTIVAIDGQPVESFTVPMLARMHGETQLFRSTLVGERWWFYYWKLFGASASYRLTLADGDRVWTVDAPGSRDLPLLLRTEAEFDRQFNLSFEEDGTAVLKIGSFAPEDLERFLAFTQEAFSTIQKNGATDLKIDISANGGGDDPAWIKGLMPYLATTPYRIGSTYKKRVTAENVEPGERVGQIVSGSITTWHQPHPDNPLFYKGRTQVVIGPGTYSSAVLFANVMHDFGFARITGIGGAARRTQSGGVRRFTLPNSKLALWIPSFVLDPPTVTTRGASLEPESPHEDVREASHQGNPVY